ncbi:MAG: oligosaccharide flippase family protein [Planctomycetes bacterium]|nr:oligosaccharide flippase family protein [Planctomycetota bacterium]
MRKGGLSVLDQGLFAGANFVINILLARWLAPNDFGAFTLSYSIFLFLGAFYLAAFMEPFLIFAAGRYADRFARYFRLVISWHWLVVTTAALLVATVAGVLFVSGHTGQGMALIGLAVALPFLFQQWFMRTVFYSQVLPAYAAAGSAIFFVLQVGGIVALHSAGMLRPMSAFMVSGLASGCAGLAMHAMLRTVPRMRAAHGEVAAADADHPTFRRQVLADHLAYSKWASGVSVIAWLCANVHYFILTATPGGLAAVGMMKVLDNLLTPFYQCISALGQFLQPIVSSHADNPRRMVSKTWLIAGIWSVIALGAYAFLTIFGEFLLHFLFGPSFVALSGALGVFSLVVFPYAISMALMLGCRAKVRTDLVFLYHLLFSVVLTAAYLVASRGSSTSDEVMGIVWSNLSVRLLFIPVIFALFLRAAYGRPTSTASVGGAAVPCANQR